MGGEIALVQVATIPRPAIRMLGAPLGAGKWALHAQSIPTDHWENMAIVRGSGESAKNGAACAHRANTCSSTGRRAVRVMNR